MSSETTIFSINLTYNKETKQYDQVASSISILKVRTQDPVRRKAGKRKGPRLWKQSLHMYGELGGNCYA